jgi:hypothetical protein
LKSRNFISTSVCRLSAALACLLIAGTDAAAGEVSFRNDVMAVISKAGCNAGTCHGNKNGKGGFKLSLRGQDPDQDYLALTRDVYGRRANSVEPDESLMLLKATTQVAHEGGQRFKKDSAEFKILRQWIAGGAPKDPATVPVLERIEVTPRESVLIEPQRQVQIQVRAFFSNGEQRDVTSMAVYEPANRVVKAGPDGAIERVTDGESTVIVRFLSQQVPVRLTLVPARPDFRWSPVPRRNYIDEHIFGKLKVLRLNPSGLCTDEVFVRRAYLDLLGLLPRADEAIAFAADSRRDKRARLVERLLERPEFADFWGLKWADLLRNEAHSLDQKGVQNFHHWIRESVASNMPLDEFARQLLDGVGSTYSSPASNYYRPNRDPATRAKAVAQVFLGTRLQCAECHNHPFDRWTQDDYYSWAGLFARVGYKVIENKREIGSDKHEWKGEQVVFASRDGQVTNPRTGRAAQPRFLGDRAKTVPGDDPLLEAARWVTSAENPLFARVQANRIWYHLMGRGLVDPIDDFRATNLPSHPALLDALAADLVRHKFDLRAMIRLIMDSRAYQLASEPNETNQADEVNYSHALVRRLGAEQMLDCQSQVAGVPLRFNGYPIGMRAAQLPGVRPESKGKRRANELDQFLEAFGKPPRLLTTETERSCECNMVQAFQMISGPTVNDLLAEKENRITRLIAAGRSDSDILADLYWSSLSRPPTAGESKSLLASLAGAKDRRKEFEDMLWALMNSKDFVFRR